MGWNTAGMFVQGASADEAVALAGPATATGELVGVDEATSMMRAEMLFAAESGGWAQVWNPAMDLVTARTPVPGESSLTVLFSSVASMYGFTLVADGEVQRRIVYENGEPVVNEGEPLPVEATAPVPTWGPDEDFVWAVVEAVTGTAYDDELQYRGYALS